MYPVLYNNKTRTYIYIYNIIVCIERMLKQTYLYTARVMSKTPKTRESVCGVTAAAETWYKERKGFDTSGWHRTGCGWEAGGGGDDGWVGYRKMVNDLYIECASDGLAGRAKECESSRDTPGRRSDNGKGVAHGERTTLHTHTASTTMTGRSSPLAAVCATTWIDEVCSVCVRGIMSRANFPPP